MGQGLDSYEAGFLTGTGTMLRHTFAGTANFLHKITRSLGDSVSVLSLDRKFQAERYQLSRRNPQGLGQGLVMGGESLFRGIGEGVAGLVLLPLSEVRRIGVAGLLTGSLKGLSGLIAKPVSGLLDATSKSVEGVKAALLSSPQSEDKEFRVSTMFFF